MLLGAQSHRPFHSCPAGKGGVDPDTRGRSRDPDPPPLLDLIGLPPTIREVDEFLADKSDRAYEKAVERLLASPHYGERWARFLARRCRYADSDGFEKDMWRSSGSFRDWLITGLNLDMPYDRFIIEQLAGDFLPDPNRRTSASPPAFCGTPC